MKSYHTRFNIRLPPIPIVYIMHIGTYSSQTRTLFTLLIGLMFEIPLYYHVHTVTITILTYQVNNRLLEKSDQFTLKIDSVNNTIRFTCLNI